MQSRTGAEVVNAIEEKLEGTTVDYAYVDEDEDGARYLGLVFTDGETEYHLIVRQDGIVELDAGPEEGNTIQEVMSFSLGDVKEPFSSEAIGDEG